MWKGRSTVRITRDSVLFVFGIAGIGYETLVSQTDRPTLLILFAGMVGLPAFLRTDEKISTKLPLTPSPPTPPDPGPATAVQPPEGDGS